MLRYNNLRSPRWQNLKSKAKAHWWIVDASCDPMKISGKVTANGVGCRIDPHCWHCWHSWSKCIGGLYYSKQNLGDNKCKAVSTCFYCMSMHISKTRQWKFASNPKKSCRLMLEWPMSGALQSRGSIKKWPSSHPSSVSGFQVSIPLMFGRFRAFSNTTHHPDPQMSSAVEIEITDQILGVQDYPDSCAKDLPSGYVKIAIENDHRNSGFSH